MRFCRHAQKGYEGALTYYTYILLCADNTLYIGWSDDLVARLRAHNDGRGAKYTRSRRPVKLLYWEKYPTKAQAMSREWHLKQWRREEKFYLLEEKAPLN